EQTTRHGRHKGSTCYTISSAWASHSYPRIGSAGTLEWPPLYTPAVRGVLSGKALYCKERLTTARQDPAKPRTLDFWGTLVFFIVDGSQYRRCQIPRSLRFLLEPERKNSFPPACK